MERPAVLSMPLNNAEGSTLSQFVIPSGVEGPAVQRTSPGDFFSRISRGLLGRTLQSDPQAVKPLVYSRFMAGLKARPFKSKVYFS